MISNEFVRHKLDWEGWPDGLEWLSGGDYEDPAMGRLVDEALNHYIALEEIRKDINGILDSEKAE